MTLSQHTRDKATLSNVGDSGRDALIAADMVGKLMREVEVLREGLARLAGSEAFTSGMLIYSGAPGQELAARMRFAAELLN